MNIHFQRALDVIIAELAGQPDVPGLLFFGSVQRGEGTAGSDLDLYAISQGEEAWIEGRLLHHVELELHFAPARFWRGRLESKHPVITHAFATGTILIDHHATVAALVEYAQHLWAAGPAPLTLAQIDQSRYHLSDMVRDLEHTAHRSIAARLVASVLVPAALEAWCALHQVWPTKITKLIPYIGEYDAGLALAATQFYESGMEPDQAITVADMVLTPFGGRIIEYQTPRRPV